MIDRLLDWLLIVTASAFAAAAVVLMPLPAHAHDRTNDECNEAADMIGHFADARDAHKVDKAGAIKQYNDSVEAVSAAPPAARWFIEDQEDVDVLGRGIESVFDHPDMTRDDLKAQFKAACLRRGQRAGIDLERFKRDLAASLAKPVRAASSQRVVPNSPRESKTLYCHQRAQAAFGMAWVALSMSKDEFWRTHQLDEAVPSERKQELRAYVDRAYAEMEKSGRPRDFQKAEFERCMDETLR